jgi:AraC-like DNA-binding protein
MATSAIAKAKVQTEGFTGWAYREWRPLRLAEHVELVWYFEGPSAYRRKRIFPNGRVELLINMGDPYRLCVGKGTEIVRSGCLSGMQSGPMVLEQPARQSVLGVRLRPAGALALLAAPLRETSGLIVDLDAAFGRAVSELVERCQEADDIPQRFQIVAAWLSRRIAEARAATPEVAWSAARLERTAGDVAIGVLRQQTGLSKSRLAALFRDEIGLTPKLYARVLRFRRLLQMLQEGHASLADAALEAAYYDQPHMTAEFRELGGITPREFLASRHPVGDGTTAADLQR